MTRRGWLGGALGVGIASCASATNSSGFSYRFSASLDVDGEICSGHTELKVLWQRRSALFGEQIVPICWGGAAVIVSKRRGPLFAILSKPNGDLEYFANMPNRLLQRQHSRADLAGYSDRLMLIDFLAKSATGSIPLEDSDLPTLVRFGNPHVLSSIEVVETSDSSGRDANVRWISATIQVGEYVPSYQVLSYIPEIQTLSGNIAQTRFVSADAISTQVTRSMFIRRGE